MIGHATFCIVVVYNNVIARPAPRVGLLRGGLRRPRGHTWQTFRYVTLPNMQTALVAGALLAFALSFDEIIVTTFTSGPATRPCRSGSSATCSRPNQLPIVNVVALLVILLSIIPVYLAHRLTRDERGRRARGRRRRDRREHGDAVGRSAATGAIGVAEDRVA